jgi:hypothetical protein
LIGEAAITSSTRQLGIGKATIGSSLALHLKRVPHAPTVFHTCDRA